MSRLIAAVTTALYIALGFGANPAAAGDTALEKAAALRGEAMKKLVFAEPRDLPDLALTDLDGGEARLSDLKGKWLLVNFWATWCAPCRKEMPALQTLQTEMGGDGFSVVTVAVGRNPPQAVRRFFDEVGVKDLPVMLDPQLQFAGNIGVLALPVSILVDPEGREVARLIGDADWSGADAQAVIGALLGS